MSEPIILNKPDTGKYAELRNTYNILTYLDCLNKFKADITILVSVKNGICIYDLNKKNIIEKWRRLGFSIDFLQNDFASYITVMDSGKVVVEQLKKTECVEYMVSNYYLLSTNSNNDSFIKINIENKNYAINSNGLNIVVIDTVTGNIEDTVCFELSKPRADCCRLSPKAAAQCSEETDEKKCEYILEKIREELMLIPNKRVAVNYFHNLGDFYGLCATTEYVEKNLNMELILISYSSIDSIIAKFFSNKKYQIKLYKLNNYEASFLKIIPSDLEKKYEDIFYRWQNKKIMSYTSNCGENFCKALKKPNVESIDKKFYIETYGIIPGKTIFIVPFSSAIQQLPVYFWNFCAEIFKLIGFKVVFNVPNDKAHLFCDKAAYVPLKDAIGFANLCGYVFGMRTGLMDLISSTTANMTIFSTKKYAPLDKVYGLENKDERIKTVYFDEYDPFYETTYPISILSEYFTKQSEGNISNLKEMECYINIPKDSNLKLSSIELSNFTVWKNRFLEPNSRIDVSKAEYYFEYNEDKVIFKLINNVADKNIRMDADLFKDNEIVSSYNNLGCNTILYTPHKSGYYWLQIVITDKDKRIKMRFATDKLFVNYVPKATDLPDCTNSHNYIGQLINLSADIIIFITSRDAHTKPNVNDSLKDLELFNQLGIKTDLKTTYRHSFICVIDGGKVVNELVSPDEVLSAHYSKDGVDAKIISRGWNCVKSANASVEININGTEYAVNKRGLNIVVWDKKSQKVVDSVAIDFFKDGSITR